ncbi:MAG: SIR2 family protein [Gammaproteobacteria bacterium]|nr:SIR2 family protein [Gammaproteobacteria bacterium]MBU1624921.1 SIR2 family protein [Gammaproteobacteria bacterium]MBU1982220.1 SIR2 family protein [Gammaproteobacteria bacterium]
MSKAFDDILSGLHDGSVVPYLGPGALNGVTDPTGKAIPADSDSLILAMNNGQPMAPKLMYEFPRAAMNIELKRGRKAVNNFLDATYKDTQWSSSELHTWLAAQRLPYMIDANRDTQMQLQYAGTPHTLVVGIARMSGTAFRFKLYHYDGTSYTSVEQEAVDSSLPILFKPLGTPTPESNYIASDADFVDYITELMGGFAIPSFIKRSRQNKRYVTLGLRLNRDTDRMVFSDVIFGADKPAGWALIPHPTDKEKRYLERLNIEIVNADIPDLLAAAQGVGTALEAA